MSKKEETKIKRPAWRPKAEDPKQTIFIGVETSILNAVGGKEKAKKLCLQTLKISANGKKKKEL